MQRKEENRGGCQCLVDKVCELQRQICEYERYVKDLAVMLAKGEVLTVVIHEVPYPADWVWDEIEKIIKEKDNAGKVQEA